MLRSILMTLATVLWMGVLMGMSDCSGPTEPSRSSCSFHSHCPGSYCASDGLCSVG
jgi:hypothetical protein